MRNFGLGDADRYRSIVENALDGFFQITPEGKIISANPAFAKIMGFNTPEELIHEVIDIWKYELNPGDKGRFEHVLREHGTIRGFETLCYHKDKNIMWVSVNARLVRNNTGEVLFYEGTIQDITDRKIADDILKRNTEKLRKAFIGTINALSQTVEARDPYTSGHERRVSQLARAIAQDMMLDKDAVENIRMAGTIHDLGKISVPAEILSKPGRLTDTEFSLIKARPESGYTILKDAELPYPIAEIVLQHHERINGSGYPQGLTDERILLKSKIVAVADVVEAMASHRPYRPALGIEVVLEEITQNAGILYDEDVAKACLHLFRDCRFGFK